MSAITATQRRLAGVALAALLALPRPASAQSDDMRHRTEAQALFDRAAELMKGGDYAAACPKLEEVTRLMPGKIGAMMKLAECFEGWGRLASAHTAYQLAERDAAAAKDPRGQEARDKAAALLPKIPKLAVVVDDAARGVAGLKVERDGAALSPALWGDPIPVDPIRHTLVASAPGRKTWTRTVDLAPGSGTTSIPVPVLEAEPLAPPPGPVAIPASPPPAAMGETPRLPPPVPDRPPAGGAPTWAWAVGGTGLALLGVAVGVGVDGLMTFGRLKTECGPSLNQCPPVATYDPTADNARKNRDLAIFIGAGGAGAIAVGAAVAGLVRAPKSAPPRASALRVLPVVSPAGAGLSVAGGFQ